MIIAIIVKFAEHHGHLFSILQSLCLFHVSHALFKLFHGFIDLSIVEMVLDGAHHIGHSI